jgi:xylan 1,4-beta-xylosidase
MPTRPIPTLPRRTAIALAALMIAIAIAGVPGTARAQAAATYANPVLPGDHPDPTVVRAGGAFYASATSASWAPIFPIFRSTDLVTWQQVGAVLPKAPAWSAGNYWAPELVRWSGRMLLFYSASRVRGTPCIGVATAARPEGPWRDRGPALCRPGGTIDVDPFTAADGTRWLLFKRFGSGHGIYAMRFSERRLRAVGHAHRLIGPDAPWERDVTEGPNLVLRNGTYYLFYAGGHCCRPPCSYAEGVARAPALLGPYTKAPANPLLTGNAAWKCPGHGTTIDLGPAGLFLLHHAYRTDDLLDRRRTSLLTRVDFAPDGWPVIGGGAGPPVTAPAPLGAVGTPVPASFTDGFPGGSLAPGWEWPFFAPPPVARPERGALRLGCRDAGRDPAFVARQVPVDRFFAAATVAVPRPHGPAVGLAAHGPGRVLRGIEVRGRRMRVFRVTNGKLILGPVTRAPAGGQVRLLVTVTPDGAVGFFAAPGAGGAFAPVAGGAAAAGAPPTRVALTCRGTGAVRIASVRVVASQ